MCWGCRVFLRELYNAVKAYAETSPEQATNIFIFLDSTQLWELQFWLFAIPKAWKPIHYKVIAVELYTDASEWGYGGWWTNTQISGTISWWEHIQSSTFREIKALVWEELRGSVLRHLVDRVQVDSAAYALPVVRVFCDNLAMTSCMKWGSRKKIINKIVKNLWKQAHASSYGK